MKVKVSVFTKKMNDGRLCTQFSPNEVLAVVLNDDFWIYNSIMTTEVDSEEEEGEP